MAKKNSLTEIVVKIEDALEDSFSKAPQLSRKWKEIISDLTPWFSILGVIVSVIAILSLIGMGSLLTTGFYLTGLKTSFLTIISTIFLVATTWIYCLALPGLFKKQMFAWKYLFYIYLLNLTLNVLSFDVGGFLVGGLIGGYFLFQIKEMYK